MTTFPKDTLWDRFNDYKRNNFAATLRDLLASGYFTEAELRFLVENSAKPKDPINVSDNQ